tara:strand:- start:468 stop:641 length:174 start_codon:yes stop_codon:yes gene_type:complete
MLKVIKMPKMTKTQRKNAYKAILSKAGKLWQLGSFGGMSTKDYIAIEAIVNKYLKRI